jgi:DNA uptake protein ComE-like DNA-binding protein
MSPAPQSTHHRAIALVLTTVLALGIRALARPPARPALPEPAAPVPAGPDRVGATSARLDPNTAEIPALESLPGIGPALARRIDEARRSGMVFRAPADLRRVRGIGPRLVDRLVPYLTFPATRPAPPDAAATTDRR